MKEETRECIVKARLTANEYQTFLKKVKGSDRPDNMSEYIRACIFSDDLKHSITVARELKNLNYQIRKIGVLINQIAASAATSNASVIALNVVPRLLNRISHRLLSEPL